MICYHGSPTKGLTKLSYSEETSRFGGADGLLHGAAIYMTISEQEARAYGAGGSCYKLEISSPVFDSTDENELVRFIKDFEAKIGLSGSSILDNYHIKQLLKSTINGKSSGVIFAENVFLVISNEMDLYNSVIVDLFKEDSDACLDSLTQSFNYSFVKLNNKDNLWVLCLDKEGKGMKIIEESAID